MIDWEAAIVKWLPHLAAASERETPEDTGLLRAGNKFRHMPGTTSVEASNKMGYAWPQYFGAKIPPFDMTGLAGTPKPGGGTYARAMNIPGVGWRTKRKGFTLPGHFWFSKGLDASLPKLARALGWARGSKGIRP